MLFRNRWLCCNCLALGFLIATILRDSTPALGLGGVGFFWVMQVWTVRLLARLARGWMPFFEFDRLVAWQWDNSIFHHVIALIADVAVRVARWVAGPGFTWAAIVVHATNPHWGPLLLWAYFFCLLAATPAARAHFSPEQVRQDQRGLRVAFCLITLCTLQS